MYRGIKTFQCARCGERFQAPDVEYMATALSMPQPCPKCGSLQTRPAGLLGRLAEGRTGRFGRGWRKDRKNKTNK